MVPGEGCKWLVGEQRSFWDTFNAFLFSFLFFFGALTACRSFQARDRTQAAGVTRATSVTMLYP